MIRMVTTIDIQGKMPEAIYNWVVTLNNERYRRWHPAHIAWRTIRRTPEEVGSIVFLDERFEGFRVRYVGEVVAAIPDRLLRYKLKRGVPLPAHLALRFEPTKVGTIVTHELTVGYDTPVGKVLDRLVRKTVLTPAFEKALERHAREEFKNLERLV